MKTEQSQRVRSFYSSFTTSFLSISLQVRRLPLERLLLETDAPWCEIKPTHAGHGFVQTSLEVKKKPEKFEWGMGVKGRCEPWMMRQVLEVVAAVKQVPQETVARHAHFNARRVFGLPSSSSSPLER